MKGMLLFIGIVNQMERIHMQRLVILTGILILVLMGVVSPGDTKQLVPQLSIEEIEARARHQKYIAKREVELWNVLVDAIAAETQIKDRELAEIVTQAIEDASSEFDLSPWLIASLIRVESGGNPGAVSRVGAIGLTQIMPRTGAEIAARLEIPNYTTASLNDPAINVRMGCAYLRELLDRFGSEHAALAAYNWGPTHIAKRIKRREALPMQYPSKILQRIPEQPAWVEENLSRS